MSASFGLGMRSRHTLPWFLLNLSIALLWYWPAASLDSLLDNLSGHQLRLAQPSGRLFQGQAVLLLRHQQQWQRLQAVHWQWHGWDLLRGQLHISLGSGPVQPSQGGQMDRLDPVEIRMDTRGYAIKLRQLHLEAARIAPLLPAALSRYAWQGQFEFNSADAYACTWSDKRCQGSLDILWQHAGISQLAGGPLGDYTIRVQAENQTHQLQIDPLRGRLALSGSGSISPQKGLDFHGTARLAPSTRTDDELQSLLNTLGRRQADGSTLLEYRQTR